MRLHGPLSGRRSAVAGEHGGGAPAAELREVAFRATLGAEPVGECVSEPVGVKALDVGGAPAELEHLPYRGFVQRPALTEPEAGFVREAMLGPDTQVRQKRLACLRSERDDASAAELAEHSRGAVREVEIVTLEPDEFADAYPRVREERDHGAVAPVEEPCSPHRRE
jgi:hypothetical protein